MYLHRMTFGPTSEEGEAEEGPGVLLISPVLSIHPVKGSSLPLYLLDARGTETGLEDTQTGRHLNWAVRKRVLPTLLRLNSLRNPLIIHSDGYPTPGNERIEPGPEKTIVKNFWDNYIHDR